MVDSSPVAQEKRRLHYPLHHRPCVDDLVGAGLAGLARCPVLVIASSGARAESMTNSRTRGSKQSSALCKVRVSQHLFHSKISVTPESIASEQRPTGSGCSSYRSGPLINQVKLTARVRTNP